MRVRALHHRSALMGLLLAAPFIITNCIVSLRIEPLYALLASFPIIRSSPMTPLLLLLLFPAGAVLSLRPMLSKANDGNRTIYIFNSILSALLIAIFLFLFIPLGKDFYTCDILKIPNCD